MVDLAGAIGAYCSRLLADLGADVVKVEPPAGDPMRRMPPIVEGEHGHAQSAVFAAYHVNKRGLTLDITRPEAGDALEALAATADVVVLSPTRRTPVVGFDRETRRAEWARPGCIVASITPFGLVGPWRDVRVTPFLSFAIGGGMHWVGRKDGPPLAPPGQIAWDEAGLHAALGIVSALVFGGTRAEGQLLDLAVHDVTSSKDFLRERFDVDAVGEWGRTVGVGIPPTGSWQCTDGLLEVSAHQPRHWEAFLDMLDHPDELSEPSLADPLVRREIFDGLEEIIGELVRERSRMELFEKGQAVGLPCAPVNGPGEFVRDLQPLARELLAAPAEEGDRAVTIPWRWCHSSEPLLRLTRPAPALGQHNREIYCQELGFSDLLLKRWAGDGVV